MSNVHMGRKDSGSTANIRSKMESKQSSKRHQDSKTAREGVPSLHENQSVKYQNKLKGRTFEPHSSLPPELKRETDGIVLVRPKSSRNHQSQCIKGKATKHDELVKYMSNLPGYLQRMEGGENLQDNTFNVGVLDWARLERWKYNHKHSEPRSSNESTKSCKLSFRPPCNASTFSSVAQRETSSHRSGQQSSRFPGPNSLNKDSFSRGKNPSRQKVLHFQDYETSSKSTLCEQRMTPKTYDESFGRYYSDLANEKGKRRDPNQKITSEMGNLSGNLKSNEVTLSVKEKVSALGCEAKKGVEETQESIIIRRDLDYKNIPELEASCKSKTYGVSPGSKEKTTANKTKKPTKKLQESDIDLGHQHLPSKRENIVLLLPRELSRRSSLDVSKGPQADNLVGKTINNPLRGFPGDKVCSAELCSDISYTCSPSSKLEPKIDPDLKSHSHINNKNMELLSDILHVPLHSRKTSSVFWEDRDPAPANKTISHETTDAENMKELDQEMAELAAKRGRHPSPNRRFSFSFGRLGRSFSLKESSASPPLSSAHLSVRSGPLIPEDPCLLDESNREKANGPTRTWSSPFKRILDPLRRSKGSRSVHGAETGQPLNRSLSRVSSRSISASESLQHENNTSSTIQALLRLTVKNGLPLFKFAVENNSSFLAAKNLTLSGKDDSVQNFTFYSVNETKRKSGGWITQASKAKSCDLVYKVGQMKISSQLENRYRVKESVLFGVGSGEVGQTSPGFMSSKELGAAVVKMPGEILSLDTERSNTEWFPGSGYSFDLGETGNYYDTTVIFPGGVHSFPDNGAPSPLIERWKSGGLCDCGGWDVGCKLRVFSNNVKSIESAPKMNTCQNSDRFELFIQEGNQQNRPVLNLVPLNGEIYSVEFNSSLSLLQAFFVCVTVLSCQKTSGLFEEKGFPKPIMNENEVKNSANSLGEKPVKYATPNPPSSPVGRV